MTAWTWDRVETESMPPETTVRICVRGDLAAEKERLESELEAAQRADLVENRTPVAPQVAQQIRDLEDQIEKFMVEFRFRALGRKHYTDLIATHPATAAQQETAGEGYTLPWNPETFQPALVAASCVEPAGVTLERAQRAATEWSLGQWSRLWGACMAANSGSADPGPKSSRASAVLRDSTQS